MKLLEKIFGEKKMSIAEVVDITDVELFLNCHNMVQKLIDKKIFIEELGVDRDCFTDRGWWMVNEFLWLSLCLVDRVSFELLGPERRKIFMDALLDSVSSNLAKALIVDSAPIHMSQTHIMLFNDNYRRRSIIYGKYSHEQLLDGTLFVEAAKNIANEVSLVSKDEMVDILCSVLDGLSLPLGPLAQRIVKMK